MTNTGKIILGASITAVALVAVIVIAKRLKKGTSSASSTPTIPLKDNSAALKNNYVIWTYAMIKLLSDTGNISAASELQNQLNTAWSGNGSVPVYDHKPVLDVLPTNGMFPNPNVAGSVSGQAAMLKQVFENAVTIVAIMAKNYVQGNTHGQAIGHRQGYIREYAKGIYATDNNIDAIPQQAATLIGMYGFAYKSDHALDFGVSGVSMDDKNGIINAVVNNYSSAILSALA